MQQDMNWPFDTETPLTVEAFKVGASFTFRNENFFGIRIFRIPRIKAKKEKTMKRITLAVLFAAAVVYGQEKQTAGSIDATSFIELLRSDIKAKKAEFISQGMNLPEEYSDKFWPVYRKYQFELDVLNDESL
jgi:hypothetical protein